MNTFKALVKREFLDGKNGYFYVPAILAAIMLGITLIGVLGSGHVLEINDIHIGGAEGEVYNLGQMMELAKSKAAEEGKVEELPAAIALMYWGLGMVVWAAFPFVVFFSLLGSLYEERRDKSILFWKSMPTSDMQEVLAKLFTGVIGVFFVYLAITVALQIILALFLGLVVMFQGGNLLDMWPLAHMAQTWIFAIPHYLIMVLWAAPLFAWLLIVSAYAPRMTFMYAVLPPIVLIIIEEMLFDTERVAKWIGTHMGGWQQKVDWRQFDDDIDGPKELFARLHEMPLGDMIGVSLASPAFWTGLAIAGLFTYGAIELRKRAV